MEGIPENVGLKWDFNPCNFGRYLPLLLRICSVHLKMLTNSGIFLCGAKLSRESRSLVSDYPSSVYFVLCVLFVCVYVCLLTYICTKLATYVFNFVELYSR